MGGTTQLRQTLHQQILGEFEANIVSGRWPPGFHLPFETGIAATYGVSRMTVNKVMTQLARSGLIERHRKRGSFVAQPRSQAAILDIHDIETEVRALGLDYGFVQLGCEIRQATKEDASCFETPGPAKVIAVKCLHLAGGAPFCLEDRLISLAVVPDAENADFTAIAPGKWLQLQVPWIAAEHKIRAAAADVRTARHLKLSKAAPCLVIERRTWNEAGPVTFVRFFYPAEKHAMVARFTPATTAHGAK